MNSRSKHFALGSFVIATVWSAGVVAQPLRQVNINSTPAGAQVHLDAIDAPPLPGVTPLRRVRVRSGQHTLFFTLNGYLPGRLAVNVTRANESWTGVLTQAGSILVSCNTDGAQLFLDNQPQGSFPRTEPLTGIAPGQHIVEVRAQGMQTSSETVNVIAGQQAALRVTLAPPAVQAPTTGGVRVVVLNPAGPVPADVAVTFDGAPMTGTPPSVTGVSPGVHIVQVTARGFRSELVRDVNVTAGQTTNVPIELHVEQVAPTTGTVQVIVPFPQATVTIDGQAISGPPYTREGVTPGAHELRISTPGHAEIVRPITVTIGQATVVTPAATDFGAGTGRLVVRTNVPGATISLNDQPVGQGTYENAAAPAGPARITVSAPGYQPFSETCNVSTAQPCEISAQLTGLAATLNINRTPAIPAHVIIDGQDRGEVAPSMPVPAGHHRIELRAQGYRTYSQEIDVTPGQAATINATLGRNQVSTYGAMPLAPGDVAFDLATHIFDIPLEARGTIGLFRSGRLGVDAGFGFLTTLSWYEFQVRARAGYQLTDFFSVGGEMRLYGAFGSESGTGGSGVTAQLNAAFNRAPSSGAELGAFTFAFHLGVEHNNDSVGPTRTPPSFTDAVVAGFSSPPDNRYYFCEGTATPGLDPRNPDGSYPASYPTCAISSTVRGYIGFNAELAIATNFQLMLGLDYYLASPSAVSSGARRAITASFWNTATQAVPRIAITFKF